MPFVKKTDAKESQRPTDARKIFIGRTEELHFFREHILKPEDPAYNIVSISGQGGVGKSTLLLRFIEDARATDFKDYCLTALVNERQTTAADIMEKFADQLHLEGDFEKALKQYKEVLHKLQSQREAAREAVARQFTTDVAGSLVKDVPFVGGLLKEGVEATTSYLFDELHYRQLLKDAERLEDPLGDLTRAFVTELNRSTETQATISSTRVKRQRRVILFFDTFEQLAAECAPWLLDYFLEADVSNNVILVIAGRDPLEHSIPDDPKRWLPYRDDNTVYSISLDSFTLEETRRYLAERGIVEEDRIEAIWHLSQGLPLYLGLLTSNPHGQVDPTANVVANFLRWIPEQEQVKRRLALDASLFSRPFNQDEIGAFPYISEQERPTLFQWLITQPFVRSNLQDGRYSYHELAEELFNRHLYQLSPNQCHATRKELVKYYQRLLMDIEASQGKDIYGSPQWLELTLALVYQLLLLPDEASHVRAIEQIFNAGEYMDDPGEFIKTLRKLPREIIDKQVSSDAQQIIKYFLQLLEHIEIANKTGEEDIMAQRLLEPTNYFLEKVNHVSSFSVKVLAIVYNFRGYIYFKLKQYEQAIADYTRAIELHSSNVEFYDERGNAYRDTKQYEQALADYTRAIELSPNNTAYYNWRGNLYSDLKQYEQALADCTRAIELSPNNAAYYNWRGNLYSDLKQYEQALADYTQAIELSPNNAAYYYSNRAGVYKGLKQYEQALADYTRAIELSPNNAAYYYSNRAGVYKGLKQYEQALADYTQAIELSPNNTAYHNWRGNLYSDLKQYEQAIIDYTRAIELSPDNAVYYSNRAGVYKGLKQYELALTDYTRAIELDSSDADYSNRRGNLYFDLKQYEQAIIDYTRAIELSPNNAAYYNRRGNVYFDLEQYEQALADCTRAIDLSPNHAVYYSNRAGVSEELKQYEQAIADYSRAIELAPDAAYYYSYRGNAYHDLKQYEQAIADYTRAIELKPNIGDIYNHRGNVYRILEQYEQALADYDQAIKLDPNNIDYSNNRENVRLQIKNEG